MDSIIVCQVEDWQRTALTARRTRGISHDQSLSLSHILDDSLNRAMSKEHLAVVGPALLVGSEPPKLLGHDHEEAARLVIEIRIIKDEFLKEADIVQIFSQAPLFIGFLEQRSSFRQPYLALHPLPTTFLHPILENNYLIQVMTSFLSTTNPNPPSSRCEPCPLEESIRKKIASLGAQFSIEEFKRLLNR